MSDDPKSGTVSIQAAEFTRELEAIVNKVLPYQLEPRVDAAIRKLLGEGLAATSDEIILLLLKRGLEKSKEAK